MRARHAALLTDAALELADGIGGPICAHLPVGVEPWSPSGVEALRAAGHEVLLPVVADRAGPLDWARYDGPDALVAGPFGLWEPAGARLGPDAVRRARLVLLPALAADRRGVRLGQGGGFYDRTLPLVDADVPLVVVLDDGRAGRRTARRTARPPGDGRASSRNRCDDARRYRLIRTR